MVCVNKTTREKREQKLLIMGHAILPEYKDCFKLCRTLSHLPKHVPSFTHSEGHTGNTVQTPICKSTPIQQQ